MGIVVIGAVFVDIKGFPLDAYIPTGRNAGHIKYIHGGVSRNVVEDIANIELRPTFLSIVDDSALGEDVIRKLQRHKVNTEYVQKILKPEILVVSVDETHYTEDMGAQIDTLCAAGDSQCYYTFQGDVNISL